MFELLNTLTYKSYLEKYPFYKNLNIDLAKYVENLNYYPNLKNEIDLSIKLEKNYKLSIDPKHYEPFTPELDDLIRLHFLVVSRKVRTILEFGVGHSTLVFDHALSINKQLHQAYVSSNLRSSNNFELHSVDNSKSWIRHVKNKSNFENTTFHFSKCYMSEFNGRICTFYKNIPNICPDLIYLDAPDQHSVIGNIRGISTRNSDRVPMAGDILAIEHFLLPGTLIVVDGRSANARFLKANLQRLWEYTFVEEADQHFFELTENPLGPVNAMQIGFMKKIQV
jgi:hypothetical protein